ncbi:MAG: 30S ribosomal protein S12 methylthiotransferase RimO [Deltaproteobacteria bacterium]|nr:30S ribosomal protein S12 methylthiotransferase RimO [Deltaproteobacteria bacterium]
MKNFRVYLISLGCPKNQVDSEYLLGTLIQNGATIVDKPDEADLIAINTCAFIQTAVEEALDTILEMTRYRKDGSAKALVVLGCLPQRYGVDLTKSLPEVDLFWGSGDLDRLPEQITRLLAGTKIDEKPDTWPLPGFAPDGPGPRVRAAPFYRAYLKIAEGCSNACSYCLIPQLRGPRRSRPLAVLVSEAEALAQSGVKELILVAQDTTAYGQDLSEASLAGLLAELAQIDGLEWLRVMYAYPAGINDTLIKVMADHAKVCPYLDLPLQHASPRILKKMNRRGSQDLVELITRLRQGLPGLALRTTMMVGFPGETEEDFNILMGFIQEVRFDRLGVFKYSPEEGSKAATLPQQVPQRLKENRRRKLMAAQRRISRAANRALIGKTIPVIVEGRSSETDLLLIGRTRGQAPEIDGQVYITSGTAAPGDIKPIRISQAHDYDLVGEIQPDKSDGLV